MSTYGCPSMFQWSRCCNCSFVQLLEIECWMFLRRQSLQSLKISTQSAIRNGWQESIGRILRMGIIAFVSTCYHCMQFPTQIFVNQQRSFLASQATLVPLKGHTQGWQSCALKTEISNQHHPWKLRILQESSKTGTLIMSQREKSWNLLCDMDFPNVDEHLPLNSFVISFCSLSQLSKKSNIYLLFGLTIQQFERDLSLQFVQFSIVDIASL